MIERGRGLHVAYLGPEGTFCERAAKKYFATAIFVPHPNITDVFTAVEKGDVDYGVVPVENSIDGSVRMTLDRFLVSTAKVCGEVKLRIVHNLIAKSNIPLSQIRMVLSHPQALAQCSRFLESEFLHIELRETSSTAKAVEIVKGIENAAAIGSVIAAEKYGMAVLRGGIENEANFTRFFILGESDTGPTDGDKTSIVFSINHVPGSLYRTLEVFALNKINLTKIESRPVRGKPWNYLFYLDFEGHRTEAKCNEALNLLEKRCMYVKVFGSYQKAS